MRIVCFADTHGSHEKAKIPEGDMLVFAGDYTYDHHKKEVKQITRFNQWLGKHPHKHKIMIAGNHDKFCERDHYQASGYITNAIYLNDSGATVAGLKVWGSPISPFFNNWAFNRRRGAEIKRHWDMIPDDTQILITHGPPSGILDEVSTQAYWHGLSKGDSRKHVGCDDLAAAICRLHKLKLHVFGHVHESWGREDIGGKVYVNCSMGYHWMGQWREPIVVEIDS